MIISFAPDKKLPLAGLQGLCTFARDLITTTYIHISSLIQTTFKKRHSLNNPQLLEKRAGGAFKPVSSFKQHCRSLPLWNVQLHKSAFLRSQLAWVAAKTCLSCDPGHIQSFCQRVGGVTVPYWQQLVYKTWRIKKPAHAMQHLYLTI